MSEKMYVFVEVLDVIVPRLIKLAIDNNLEQFSFFLQIKKQVVVISYFDINTVVVLSNVKYTGVDIRISAKRQQ